MALNVVVDIINLATDLDYPLRRVPCLCANPIRSPYPYLSSSRELAEDEEEHPATMNAALIDATLDPNAQGDGGN